jgi:hypothetical protein
MCDQYERAASVLVPKYARRTNATSDAHRYAIRWPTHIASSVTAPSKEVLVKRLAERLRELAASRKLGPVNFDRIAAA